MGGAGGAPPAPMFAALALGGDHSCALMSDDSVRCWGRNNRGQLGIGNFEDQTSPQRVDLPSGAIAVAAGWNSTCVVLDDNTARCWGANSNGQLGNGNTSESIVPVAVSGLTGVVDIDVTDSHACAVLSDGSARCWGDNSFGQLGNGSTVPSPLPVPVSGGSNIATVSVGTYFGTAETCARLTTGMATCWGGASFPAHIDSETPALVQTADQGVDLDGVEAVDVGGQYVCFLRTGDELWCMGANYDYECECQSCGPIDYPRLTDTGTAVRHFAVGTFNNELDDWFARGCRINNDRSVECWGSNNSGGYEVVPVAITNGSTVAVGGAHRCVLTEDAAVRCWGGNAYGQLGDGTKVRAEANAPTLVQL